MLRAILVLLLVAFVGGLGYYFATYSEAPEEEAVASEAVRARAEPAGPPPEVGQPTAPVPDLPRSTDGLGSAPPPADAGLGNPPELPKSDAALPQPGANAAPVASAVKAQNETGNAAALADRRLAMPIANLKLADVRDTFDQARSNGERRHEATDIMAPKGTPVMAVDNGVIRKLFTSKTGGLTIYQYDPQEKFTYYYAHLDRYAPGIREGLLVKRGDVIGYVGVTGNSDPNAPHLHFAILELGPDKSWYEGTKPVNPYPLLRSQLERRK